MEQQTRPPGAKTQVELYQEFSSTYAVALARLARAYEADPDKQRDLLQEIHLELWRSFARFDGRCSLRTWVDRVAHNVGNSHVSPSNAEQISDFGDAALVAVLLWLMWYPRRAVADAPMVSRVSMTLILAGMSYSINQYRKRVSAIPISAGPIAQDCRSFHRRQLERERDYYRTGWWWGVAPIIPGFVVGFVGVAISVPDRRRMVSLPVGIFLWFLYRAWNGMQSKADKVQGKLDRFERREEQR